MNLGTHNSMTYLKPKHWYLYPFRFIAQCQSLTLEEQYNQGVRHFDLRVYYTKDGTPEFKHGMMTYKGDVLHYLKWLNDRPEPVYCKFWLETKKNNPQQEQWFKFDCEFFEERYTNIRFYGGKNKKGDTLYQFKNNEPDHEACFASLQLPLIDDLYPKRYAKKHNKEAKENCKKDLLILDFIEIE